MEVTVLGPVCATNEGREIRLGGARERAVLAALAIAGPDGISTERLVDQVWGMSPPRTAERTVQAYLSRLRSALGTDAIRTEAGRHRLTGVGVDLWQFEELRERAAVRPAEAADALTAAIGLWRDSVPARDAALDGAAVELVALTAARLEVAEAALAHVNDSECVAIAERLLAEDPHREHAWLRLATALYRLGRSADALAALRRARHALVEELGLDPSSALVQLERDLLNRVSFETGGVAPPAALTGLVGREQLLDDLADRIGSHRLVTLVGTGGIGKTRLAAAVAEAVSRQSGVPAYFAALAGAGSAAAVESTVLAAVGADPHRVDAVSAIVDRFARGPGLLVADNCEHVVPVAAQLLSDVLDRCPGLRVLTTSRVPLGVPGEMLVDVPPLTVTDAESPGTRLFIDRAESVTAVHLWGEAERQEAASVCELLDGLPLAIELTARRLRYTSLAGLRTELEDGTADNPLADALDRSVRTLHPYARRGFARLSALRGPVPADIAAAVAGGVELLAELVDNSLVVTDAGWFRMYEPVRRFAQASLDEDTRIEAGEIVAEQITVFAERAAPRLIGPDELSWITDLTRLRADVRGALEWSVAQHDDALLVRLARAVGYLWFLGWGIREGRLWLERAVAAASGRPEEAETLVWASWMALRVGELSEARSRGLRAVALARAAGDDRVLGAGLHAAAQPDKHGTGQDAARALLHEAVDVRRRCGDTAGAAMSLGALADIDLNAGRLAEAAAGYEIGLPLMRSSGSPRGLVAYLHSMAETEVLRGNPDGAEDLAAEASPLAVLTGDVWHMAQLEIVRLTAARDRSVPDQRCREIARAGLAAAVAQTDPVVVLDMVDEIAGMLVDSGDATVAWRLLDASRRVRAAEGLPMSLPRRARRDRDEARAAQAAGPAVDVEPPADLGWLCSAAEDAVA